MIKEFIQMRRDRLTFAMMIGIPIIQLILFGFAINMDPKHLPTAVYVQERSPLALRILDALRASGYFNIQKEIVDGETVEDELVSGRYAFIIRIPEGLTRNIIRGENVSLAIEVDATDPAATANALGQLSGITNHVMEEYFKGPLTSLRPKAPALQWIIHRHFNPEGVTQYNIVPGLLGVILTMTMVLITSIAVTREIERGTMENLLVLPPRPSEVMLGKIIPYVLIGIIQTMIILFAATRLFHIPFTGDGILFAAGVGIFILANLSIGFLFSTLAKTQMQAMQMTFFFFLPSILLSGFMFPFQGMPEWAQFIGQLLPLTHFLPIVRGVMLKNATLDALLQDFLFLLVMTIAVGLLAITRYRKTLD
ncbi:MAG: ABC transporter permease [Gammaproteobacteria bacterium]|nr:MAG: ABC transporter permease [Gammaproteobacteria bacterium]